MSLDRKLRDTFRIRLTTNPTLQAIAPVVNGNQEAVAELQERLLRLEERVQDLESTT